MAQCGRTITQLSCLPDAVLVHILSYLPNVTLVSCSVVSRRWHRLCFDASLWRNISIPFHLRENVQNSTLKRLASCSRNVNKICLVECRNVTDDLLDFISRRCPNLRKLQLCGCVEITDHGLLLIAERCRELRKVGLAKTKVTDRGLNALIKANPHLTSIEASTQACTSETFGCLAGCAALRKLRVYETPEEVLMKTSRIALTDDMLSTLGQSCSVLTHLVLIYDYVDTTDSAICDLAIGCPSLISLELDSCPEVSDLGITALVENGALEHLHLGESRVTDATLKAVSLYLPKIRSLKLEHGDVTDNGVFYLMGHCRFLEELSLGVKVPANLTDITASIISCLSGPFLCSLEFNSCAITDRGLAILVNSSVLLTSLGLKACNSISYDGLLKALVKCHELRLLDVSFSGLVKNAKQLMEIADLLPNLCSLGAVDAEGVTQEDLEQIQTRYPLCDIRL